MERETKSVTKSLTFLQSMNEKIIPITAGTGEGSTSLAAFDAALYKAGIANHNLIHLSSVIPDNHVPKLYQIDLNSADGEFGNRLYVVYSSRIETELSAWAWAGLGWVTALKGTSRGLFVEHWGRTRQEVIDQINKTLMHMLSYRKEKFGPTRTKIVGIRCNGKPVCALVAAVYESQGWTGKVG